MWWIEAVHRIHRRGMVVHEGYALGLSVMHVNDIGTATEHRTKKAERARFAFHRGGREDGAHRPQVIEGRQFLVRWLATLSPDRLE
jgi:hypothetical protein